MKYLNLLLAALIGGSALVTVIGCDRDVQHEKSVDVKKDGTVVTNEKKVSEKPDGTIVKQETHDVQK
jgi:hypothetical protein